MKSAIIYDITSDIRLVLDTDVKLSGLRSTIGASRILLQAVDEGAIKPLASVASILEYEAVLKRPENLAATKLASADVDDFLDAFLARADHVITHFCLRPRIIDPDDEIFTDLALNGSAEALVTFNLRDYRPAGPALSIIGVPVCRPGDILRRLTWRPRATSLSASLLH